MKALRTLSLFAVVVVVVFPALAEPTSQIHPSNYVNDFAGVLDAAAESRLNSLAQQVDTKAKAQIAVVTVKSTDGRDIVEYAVDLYQKWGIGKKGTDRGVLILLAVQDRKYWTTVGYGLEPILPDGKVGGFGREAVPLLRSADYSGAVSLITIRVAQVIAADAGVTLEGVQPPSPRNTAQRPASWVGLLILLVLAAVFVLVIWALSKASGGGGSRGGGSGFTSGLLTGILIESLRSRGGSGWSGGGGFGGGSWGGGGGFGGFGGGSTGGGGAGGSW